MSSTNPDFLGPYTEANKLTINKILKELPTAAAITNGVIYEIWNSSPSDDAAARTILRLGEGRQEFGSTNIESLRKKIQISYNKIKMLKKKGNKNSLDAFAQSKFQSPVSKLSTLDQKEQKIIETVKEKVHVVATLSAV